MIAHVMHTFMFPNYSNTFMSSFKWVMVGGGGGGVVGKEGRGGARIMEDLSHNIYVIIT